MKTARRLSLFAAAALALPLALSAADGRIPISSVPFTISQPGHYYLTQDLSLATAGSTMIGVFANDVTLDLGGHTLTETGTGTTYVIFGSAINRFEVYNGRIQSGTYGIYLATTSGQLRGFRLHDLNIDFAFNPIYFTVTTGQFNNVEIERCRIWVNNATQIYLRNVNNGSVAACTLYNVATSGNGIDATGSNLEIGGNRVFGGSGVVLTGGAGFSIHDNTVRGIAGVSTGISLAGVTGSFIDNNRISASSSAAISLSANANGNELRNNDISGALTGLIIAGSTGNIYSGTRVTGSTVPYNIAAGNTNGGDNQ